MADHRHLRTGTVDLDHAVELAAEPDQARRHRLGEAGEPGVGHDVLRELAVEIGDRDQPPARGVDEIVRHIGVDVRHVEVRAGAGNVDRDRAGGGAGVADDLDHPAATQRRKGDKPTTTTRSARTRLPPAPASARRPFRAQLFGASGHRFEAADSRAPRRARHLLAMQRPAHGHRVGPGAHRPGDAVGAADGLGLGEREQSPVGGGQVLDGGVDVVGVVVGPRRDGGSGVEAGGGGRGRGGGRGLGGRVVLGGRVCAGGRGCVAGRACPGEAGQVDERVVHGPVQRLAQAAAFGLGEGIGAVEVVPGVLGQLDQPVHPGQELVQAAALSVDRVG